MGVLDNLKFWGKPEGVVADGRAELAEVFERPKPELTEAQKRVLDFSEKEVWINSKGKWIKGHAEFVESKGEVLVTYGENKVQFVSAETFLEWQESRADKAA